MTAALRSVAFRRERQEVWRELEEIVAAAEKKGVSVLDGDQLARLPKLWRGTLSSLSVARAISLDKNLVEYLESLCGRAYCVVYGVRPGALAALGRFFAAGWPQAVRRAVPRLALSLLALALGTAAAFLLVLDDPERFFAFVHRDMIQGRDPLATTEHLRSALYGGQDEEGGALAHFTSFLFSHNSGIAMLAFALGLLAGLPVLPVIFSNGLTLGAFAAVHHERGLSLDLWGWLLPHGITELLAIVLAGAAGLGLGQAMLFPGRLRRRDALVEAGRDGARLVAGSVVMLLVAGVIEGVFRQTVQSVTIRYLVAAATFMLWTHYFAFAGRPRTSGSDVRS